MQPPSTRVSIYIPGWLQGLHTYLCAMVICSGLTCWKMCNFCHTEWHTWLVGLPLCPGTHTNVGKTYWPLTDPCRQDTLTTGWAEPSRRDWPLTDHSTCDGWVEETRCTRAHYSPSQNRRLRDRRFTLEQWLSTELECHNSVCSPLFTTCHWALRGYDKPQSEPRTTVEQSTSRRHLADVRSCLQAATHTHHSLIKHTQHTLESRDASKCQWVSHVRTWRNTVVQQRISTDVYTPTLSDIWSQTRSSSRQTDTSPRHVVPLTNNSTDRLC